MRKKITNRGGIPMDIEVLGTGCAKCKKLEENVRGAVAELGIEATVTKVEDIAKIMEHGVMSTPGVVIDGVVKGEGRIPSQQEIKNWLQGK
jgi:small redox-active disulfide protein 2